MTEAPRAAGLTLIYDGACPFCSRYVQLLRLRRSVGEVRLVDARQAQSEVRRLAELGFSLDDGMVLLIGDAIYSGADAMTRLALLSTGSDGFNRFNQWLFRSSSRSRLLYPWLRAGRNSALRLLGRPQLRGDDRSPD